VSIQITPTGHQTLQSELDQLENRKRPQLVERIAHARTQGDLSENSDYINAKQELEMVDNRIEELQAILNQATVIKKPPTDKVALGHAVTVSVAKTTATFNIVSQFEADPTKGRISPESPIGQALIGKQKGDTVQVSTPTGETTYKILKIE
jgi:transcription elongation factor GreA